jgi:glycosyl transferase family 25
MKTSTERWDSMTQQAAKLGLEFQQFEATVGKALNEQELTQWYNPHANLKKYHRNMTPGEIGCYVSHMRIWEKMVAENINFCLVLEDDIIIDEQLTDIIATFQTLKEWDMIKLHDNRQHSFYEKEVLADYLTVGNYLQVPNGTQGYILSLAGAKKLLNRKPFFRPVDVDIQFHSEINFKIIGIKPYPLKEDLSFNSEITVMNKGKHSNRSTFLRNAKHRVALYLQRRKPSANMVKVTSSCS